MALFSLGLIALLDLPLLVMRGERRERLVFLIVLGIALLFCLAATFRWQLLNPTPVIEALFRPLSRALLGPP